YYIRAIHECEDHARKQYYPEELKSYPQKDFVKLLVRDGCFIVEYFLRNFFKVDLDMADDSGWVPSLLRRDLMLFENQIPYFVLVKLFEETHIGDVRVREISPYLMDLALRSLGVEGDLPQVKPQEVDKALHLLHLLHLYHRRRLINYDLTEQQQSTADHHSQEVPKMIPNAIELDKAGVKFKKKDDVDSPLKVSFSNGLLEIPSLSVDEETSTRLRNFIAFEQSFNDVKNHFISYAFFMDNIINTESDVALLRKHKIIQSKLGSDKEVANMFNKLCKGTYINYGNHYNAGLFVDVNAYCEVPLNRWRASLKSTHLHESSKHRQDFPRMEVGSSSCDIGASLAAGNMHLPRPTTNVLATSDLVVLQSSMADPLASWMWTSLTEPPQHVGHVVVVNMDVFDGSVPEVVEKFVLPAAPDSDPQEGQVDLKEYSGGGQITGREEIKNPDIAEIEDQMETEEDLISIWRLHSSIREQESEAYEPKIVSIGPLHHGKKRLHAMEQTKWRYVQSLIDRSPNNSIRYYIRAIHECEDHARKQYYPEELKSYPQKDFVKLLVRDGCFIVEYFLRNFFKVDLDMADDSGWVPSLVRRDLMLFENQIPYFVLVKLFEETHIGDVRVREISPNLMDLALRSLGVEGDLPQVKPQEVDKALHLLHLLHLYHRRRLINYDLTEQQQSTAPHSQEVPKMIPNAIELDKAGVKFKKKDDVDSPLKVSFSNGLLEIPSLSVDEETSTRLRNFIAFEQSFNDVKNHFISYAFFMDNIINTESDVALLRKHKIIQSKLGSDKEVANMFNKLCKGTYINYGNHYNAGLFVDVNAYCEVPLNRWRASLKSTHLRNPWTVISLLAGILLISLALIQTIFTIIK
ncbi:hypothetical protein Taro_029867, partial [Colocasia esculenta]|nr:hypothetical protein [Colocasia esculenta]